MGRSKLVVVLAVAGAALMVPGSAQGAKTFSPTTMAFPPTPVDQESAPQIATYSVAAADSHTVAPYIGRGAAGPCPPNGFCAFRFTTTCPVYPLSLPAGDYQCTFSVYFTPYETGPATGELQANVGPPTVALSGTGTSPASGGHKKPKCKKKHRSASAAKKCKKKKKKKKK